MGIAIYNLSCIRVSSQLWIAIIWKDPAGCGVIEETDSTRGWDDGKQQHVEEEDATAAEN